MPTAMLDAIPSHSEYTTKQRKSKAAAYRDSDLTRKCTKRYHINNRLLERAIRQTTKEKKWLEEAAKASGQSCTPISSTRVTADAEPTAESFQDTEFDWIIVPVEECTEVTGLQTTSQWRIPFGCR